MNTSAAEVEKAYREALKALTCPHCNTEYTDYAAEWSDAWREGRRDTLREVDKEERDGPVKLKCELCGGLALTNAFLTAPTPL